VLPIQSPHELDFLDKSLAIVSLLGINQPFFQDMRKWSQGNAALQDWSTECFKSDDHSPDMGRGDVDHAAQRRGLSFGPFR
jgi:hypothetical protein